MKLLQLSITVCGIRPKVANAAEAKMQKTAPPPKYERTTGIFVPSRLNRLPRIIMMAKAPTILFGRTPVYAPAITREAIIAYIGRERPRIFISFSFAAQFFFTAGTAVFSIICVSSKCVVPVHSSFFSFICASAQSLFCCMEYLLLRRMPLLHQQLLWQQLVQRVIKCTWDDVVFIEFILGDNIGNCLDGC